MSIFSIFAEHADGASHAADVARSGVWATLREALRGSSIDYTTAPVGRAVVMLAVPMVMEMAMWVLPLSSSS